MMKNEPFKFIKYSLSYEAMKSITAGANSNSLVEDHISDVDNYIYTRETDERGVETIVKYEITLDEG